MDFDDFMGYVTVIILGFIAILFVWVLIGAGVVIATSAKCKEMGYRTSTIGFPLTRYCETRIDQTDIIIPLKDAKPL